MAEKQWDILTAPCLPNALHASDSSFGSQLEEKHLSPGQRAELLHVRCLPLEKVFSGLSILPRSCNACFECLRNMQVSLRQQIESLSTSLAAFERAERELLLGSG